MYSWRERDPGKAFIGRMIESLEGWSQQEESIDMGEFYRYFGMLKDTCDGLRKKYPELEAACKHAVATLGLRRQRLAFFRKYNTNPQQIERTLRFYHHEWKQIYEDERSIRLKEKSDEKEIHVHITQAESVSED